ncbi:MAG: anthranilate phosphoribosyltransferase, partial [Proteobacteria bacterium]|nr:anthranilate phosphoribosyltransferase [Burkholderiales bacterium]
ETIDEIAGMAKVMREKSARIDIDGPLLDTCGTGGDETGSFNVSTCAAFIAAGAGARVAKHGNRAMTSRCGSADVLEALGVDLTLDAQTVARSIREVGVGFMFAPSHHSAMKHAAPVRKDLGVRTMFNILGPLTNPAGAPNQVMGVFKPDLVALQAHVLQVLGSRHVMVVHGADGLDEITVSGDTDVAELREGRVTQYRVNPAQFGLAVSSIAAIRVESVDAAKAMLLAVLADTPGAARDIVAMNAGAAIYVSGIAPTLEAGVKRATEVIASGAARAKLDQLVGFSRSARP